MGDFKDLKVWHRGLALGDALYRVTSTFPDGERYGLVTQLRRASVSITSNIAEGCGRGTDLERCQFYRIARGSAQEIESQLRVALQQHMIGQEDWRLLDAETQRISRMLAMLIRSLGSRP